MAIVGNKPSETTGGGDVIGDVRQTAAALDTTYLNCDGAIYLKTSYPDLHPLLPALAAAPPTLADITGGGASEDISLQDSTMCAIRLNADGSKMWVVGRTNDKIFEYKLGAPGDSSTASLSLSFSVGTQTVEATGLCFNADYTRMWVTGLAGFVYEYDLPTPGTVNGALYQRSIDISAQDTSLYTVHMNKDFSRMWTVGDLNDSVYEYDLPTPGTIAGASYTGRSIVITHGVPTDVLFSPNFDRFWVACPSVHNLYQYDVPVAGTIADAVYNSVYYYIGASTFPQGVEYVPNIEKMFVVNAGPDTVYQYNLPNPTSDTEFAVPTITSDPKSFIKAL